MVQRRSGHPTRRNRLGVLVTTMLQCHTLLAPLCCIAQASAFTKGARIQLSDILQRPRLPATQNLVPEPQACPHARRQQSAQLSATDQERAVRGLLKRLLPADAAAAFRLQITPPRHLHDPTAHHQIVNLQRSSTSDESRYTHATNVSQHYELSERGCKAGRRHSSTVSELEPTNHGSRSAGHASAPKRDSVNASGQADSNFESYFEVSRDGESVTVRGTSGVELAAGIHWFLKYRCVLACAESCGAHLVRLSTCRTRSGLSIRTAPCYHW